MLPTIPAESENFEEDPSGEAEDESCRSKAVRLCLVWRRAIRQFVEFCRYRRWSAVAAKDHYVRNEPSIRSLFMPPSCRSKPIVKTCQLGSEFFFGHVKIRYTQVGRVLDEGKQVHAQKLSRLAAGDLPAR